jgi:hypothetical protein
MKLAFSRLSCEKSSNTKFHENASSWKPSCSMRTDKRTDMTKLIVAFRNFAKAPKIYTLGTNVLIFPDDVSMFCTDLSLK